MANSTIEIKVTQWPELIWCIRDEIVKRLREEADSEADPRVALKLKKVALDFELSLTEAADEV